MARESSPLLPPSTASQLSHRIRIVVGIVVLGFVAIAVVAWQVVIAHPTTSDPIDSVTFPMDVHGNRDLLSLCEEFFITQQLDHFDTTVNATYAQRYFVCGHEFFDRENGVIFFYTGNEANVELYVNHTGLMWENAQEFHAVMVFVEHRYYGQSIPFGSEVLHHMQYLSSVQALADYAVLLEFLQHEWKTNVPVIGFGGSYGGMLATWFRLQYPQLMHGVIAASAPMLSLLGDSEHPTVDTNAFRRIVAFDMSLAAGSSPNCIPNVRKAFAALNRLVTTPQGRQTIGETLAMCNPEIIQSPSDIQALTHSAIGAFGSLAMGNYPYPTAYLTENTVELPAYPVRATCEHLADDLEDNEIAILTALRNAVGVFYNATGALSCYFPVSAPSETNQTLIELGSFWGYLACSELYMPSSSDGLDGVFPVDPLNLARDDANCMASWGIHLRPNWASSMYGGLRAIRASSNIIFSNGNYDPLSGTGILENQSETIVAVLIDGGAHHADLFFHHPMDPPSLTHAREIEKQHMRMWVREFYDRNASIVGQ